MSVFQKLVLASGSPRRIELLQQAGIEPDRLLPADIDETPLRAEHPRSLAKRLAKEKAEKALASLKSEADYQPCFVLAADTVVARRPAHPAQGRDDRRGVELPAAAVGPHAPRLFRRLPDHAGREGAPAAGRDQGALQAARPRRARKLSRLGRMARQGRRLRRPGPGRHLRRQARRLLHQCRRPAALRDRRPAQRRRLPGAFQLAVGSAHER